jgi:hypothetical protein
MFHLLALSAFDAFHETNSFFTRHERRFGLFADDGAGAGGGKGDDGEGESNKPVPYAEHKKVRQALAKAKSEIAERDAKIAEFERKAPDVAKVAKERDDAIGRANNAEKDLQLRDLGVTDADDRAFIRERYNMTTNGQGDKAPDFGDWLEGQREKRWFQAMIPDAAEPSNKGGDEPAPRSEYAANKGKEPAKGADDKGQGGAGNGAGAGVKREPEKKPAFNPNAGTRGASGGNGRPAFTREEIGSMSTDEYKANREAIMSARREGRIE